MPMTGGDDLLYNLVHLGDGGNIIGGVVWTEHHQVHRLDEEVDRLWDEGILNQEKLDELRHTDLHAK